MRKLIAAAALAACAGVVSVASAAPVQWAGNGHWYEFVSRDATWQEARTDASSRTFNGMTGYLATLTSADENLFASFNVAEGLLAWFGATDEVTEGQWRWADGPEAGQSLAFFSWASGEPNDCCTFGEDYAHTNWAGVGLWNDHGLPANGNQRNGYLVEYSPASSVPEPASIGLALAALGAVVGLRRRRR